MRIVTRPDFDGIVCAALLLEAEKIDEPILWAEPNEIQRGGIEIRKGDILANLPFDSRCSIWFDHHFSSRIDIPFQGAFELAPSAAGIIYRYYRSRFRRDYSQLIEQTDRIDSANLTLEEVLNPEQYPYILIYFTVSHSAPNDSAYWNRLVDLFRTQPLSTILEDAEIDRRCRQTLEWNRAYADVLKAHTRCIDHISITDFRPLSEMPKENRFLVFSLYPKTVVNLKMLKDYANPEQTLLKLSRSIFTPGCKVNVGNLLARYGGGGHAGAGSARLNAADADRIIEEVLQTLIQNEDPGK